jgi:hypothetical protein
MNRIRYQLLITLLCVLQSICIAELNSNRTPFYIVEDSPKQKHQVSLTVRHFLASSDEIRRMVLVFRVVFHSPLKKRKYVEYIVDLCDTYEIKDLLTSQIVQYYLQQQSCQDIGILTVTTRKRRHPQSQQNKQCWKL